MVFSFAGVCLAGYVSGLPLLVKTVQATVRNELQGYIETARMLGKSRTLTFYRVILPLLKRGIVTGLFLGAARSLGDVGITLMLGGNIIGRTNTIALEVYNSVFLGEFDRAWLLAGLLGIVSLGSTGLSRIHSRD
jgi:molybdate transport system permease protein